MCACVCVSVACVICGIKAHVETINNGTLLNNLVKAASRASDIYGGDPENKKPASTTLTVFILIQQLSLFLVGSRRSILSGQPLVQYTSINYLCIHKL